MEKYNIIEIGDIDYEFLMTFIDRSSSFSILTSPLYSSLIEYCIIVVNNINVFDSDKFARISMIEPKYINDEYKLTEEEKIEFIKLVTNNWDKIIFESNKTLLQENEKLIPMDLPIPDYTKLPERK